MMFDREVYEHSLRIIFYLRKRYFSFKDFFFKKNSNFILN